jgi:hypothetical protein
MDRRDFFISFNSADLAYAEAINSALVEAKFSTFFHPRDLSPGGNIAMWMSEALENSMQTLALYSPNYTADQAIFSKAERYAIWWQDPATDRRRAPTARKCRVKTRAADRRRGRARPRSGTAA